MPNIHKLDTQLINKIAAGEVVERPASVIKELTENALDAKATAIAIEVRDGGIAYMRITDNGTGIPKDQVPMAFLRHTTSKIAALEDLEAIMSLGFRGEALSSIAAVAQVTLTTKTAEDETGLCLEINGGEIVKSYDIGTVNGSTFEVRNLFYNTPARRKFLKKQPVESGHIAQVVNRFAMGYPHVAFQYTNNKTLMLQTKGDGDLLGVLLQIYGKETVKNVLPVRSSKNGLTIEGYVGKPILSRGNRGHQHFFINGRMVKCQLAQEAVEKAFASLLMHGRYPFYVLQLSIDPTLVDVNVHPTKLEVRFAGEEAVYQTVFDAISKALKQDTVLPTREELNIAPAEKATPIAPLPVTDESHGQPLNTVVTGTTRPSPVADALYGGAGDEWKVSEAVFPLETAPQPTLLDVLYAKEKPVKKRVPQGKIIGQVFGTYWLIEQDGVLYVIDQHAAHERVLYDELMEKAKAGTVASQQLLQPAVVKLTEEEVMVFQDNQNLFEQLGFDVEVFGQDTYALRGVPYVVQGEASAQFFIDMLDKLKDVSTAVTDLTEAKMGIIFTTACKAAVKANDKLSFIEAKALIEQLLTLEGPYTCPHGRPTVVEIPKEELERRFKRLV